MNIGALIQERDRLNGVIAEAKVARKRIKQINVLIAMYGDDEKVSLLDEECEVCNRHFDTKQALGMHKSKAHGIKGASRTTKAAAKKGGRTLRQVS